MTKEEALEILKLYQGWDFCQTGAMAIQKDLIVSRTKLLIKATEVLTGEE